MLRLSSEAFESIWNEAGNMQASEEEMPSQSAVDSDSNHNVWSGLRMLRLALEDFESIQNETRTCKLPKGKRRRNRGRLGLKSQCLESNYNEVGSRRVDSE
jgi:hypothetical protein